MMSDSIKVVDIIDRSSINNVKTHAANDADNTDDNTDDSSASHASRSSKELNGFWHREAKRMARNPRMYLLVALTASIVMSVIGMIGGKFSISANTGGWQSRGTMISDRHAQVLLVQTERDYLFTGGEEAWKDLTENVQRGLGADGGESDDGTDAKDGPGRRSLAASWTSKASNLQSNLRNSKAPRHRKLPFIMTKDLTRRLQDQEDTMPGCNFDWYNSKNMTAQSRLWPIWKVKSSKKSALDADVLYDICVAEQNTQSFLEKNELCFGCDEGCLPPMSIVMYARLLVSPNGLQMSCEDLRDSWEPYQAQTQESWAQCVTDIDTEYDAETKALPGSCPDHFSPAFVNYDFDETELVSYTSSIFATLSDDDSLKEMYDQTDELDQGSDTIEGVYDTQNEDFVDFHATNALGRDMALAMGSAIIVAIAIVIHTRSPFVTLIGLLQIILSFPLSYFIYYFVLGFDFFPFLNFLGIFVIFGLGADDIFVATDKWKHARSDNPSGSTEDIAAAALPDAASAMLLTTVTTAVAFFATAICPVAPVKMFAIFCGLLVMLDYLMNVLLVFPALCIYDIAIQKSGGRVNCCIQLGHCGALGRKGNDTDESPSSKDDGESDGNDDDGSSSDSSLNTIDTTEEDRAESLIHRILVAYYHGLHLVRWPLVAFSLVALGLSAYFASTLELPTSSDVRVLKEDVQYEQNYVWRQKLLYDQLERSQGGTAQVIWGVVADDTGDLDNPDSWTQLVLDDSFEPSSVNAQEYLLQFCDDLFDEEFASPVGSNFTCAMKGFDDWLGVQSAEATADAAYNQNCGNANALPMSPDDFHSCMTAWAQQVDNKSVLSRNGSVTIITLPFNSRVRYDDQYAKLDDEWKLIEDWMNEQTDKAPDGVNKSYFSSDDFWWYDTNGQMFKTAYGSAAIALATATVMLLITSRSLILTMFSTLTVAFVLCSVTATLVSLGWTLGFLESICFAILIGIACDFVLHFAHSYASLEGDISREERTKYSITHMGPSILAAAFTTIASAVVMNFTVITFFQKFGMILLITVVQATGASFLIFCALNLCFGPSNPTYLYDKVVAKICTNTNSTSSSLEKDEDSDEESNLGETTRTPDTTTIPNSH